MRLCSPPHHLSPQLEFTLAFAFDVTSMYGDETLEWMLLASQAEFEANKLELLCAIRAIISRREVEFSV
jgi:hypothetical protein